MAKKYRSFNETRDDASKYHKNVGYVLKQMFPGYNILQEISMSYGNTEDFRASKYKIDWFVKELSLAIEVDGEHHFIPVNYNNDEEEAETNLVKRQHLDKIKEKIAGENEWKLIRIPFYIAGDLNKIRSYILSNL